MAGVVTMPRTLTDGSAHCGYDDTADPAVPVATCTARRLIVPPAQRRPPPKTVPCPIPCWRVPWKNRTLETGRPPAFKVTVSAERLAVPVARSVEPTANEFKQPDCEDVVL